MCHSGYHGLYCEEEYNECLAAPCQNYATCRDLINAYECVCTPQFEGMCELVGHLHVIMLKWQMCGIMNHDKTPLNVSVQEDTVKSTRIHVWRYAARMEAAVRVWDLMLPVPVHPDTKVSTDVCEVNVWRSNENLEHDPKWSKGTKLLKVKHILSTRRLVPIIIRH